MIDRDLYDVARRLCHQQGMPWTDPRTLVTYQPPDDKVSDADIIDWCDKAMKIQTGHVARLISDEHDLDRRENLLKSQRVNVEIVRRLRAMLRGDQ